MDIEKNSCFLWGPRQCGKSTLLKKLFPDSPYFDLLKAGEFLRLNQNPELIRNELTKNPPKVPVIIDEVQKIPLLLDEVQWMIVNQGFQFILCGSSARKLKRGGANLLGGRAIRYELFPLVSKEIPDFDLIKGLNNGMLPRHYMENNPKRLLEGYIGDYLKEEIVAEALSRNIPMFIKFLQSASFSNGEVINFQNIARDCGVSVKTVQEYFLILTDTLMGRFVDSYQKRPKRRVVHAPKFYFFDLGIVNFLLKREKIVEGNEIFGRAFEHFIFQELIAHSHYSGLSYNIKYWRTTSGFEVDFILGDEIAIEVKGTDLVHHYQLKNLKAFNEEYKTKRSIVVSLDLRPRQIDNIEILPWKVFLDELWNGKVI
jgi:predicted AAA+ superfamily ATPase